MKPGFSVNDVLRTLSEVVDAKVGPQWVDKVMALRQMVLALQEDNLRLLDAKRAADERVLELERREVEQRHWDELEKIYPLRQIAGGCFARVGKRTEDPKEPTHYLCADCFRLHKESLLQCVASTRDAIGNTIRTYACNTCGTRLTTP